MFYKTNLGIATGNSGPCGAGTNSGPAEPGTNSGPSGSGKNRSMLTATANPTPTWVEAGEI